MFTSFHMTEMTDLQRIPGETEIGDFETNNSKKD